MQAKRLVAPLGAVAGPGLCFAAGLTLPGLAVLAALGSAVFVSLCIVNARNESEKRLKALYKDTIDEQRRRDHFQEERDKEARAAQIRKLAQTDPRAAARLITRRSRPRR